MWLERSTEGWYSVFFMPISCSIVHFMITCRIQVSFSVAHFLVLTVTSCRSKSNRSVGSQSGDCSNPQQANHAYNLFPSTWTMFAVSRNGGFIKLSQQAHLAQHRYILLNSQIVLAFRSHMKWAISLVIADGHTLKKIYPGILNEDVFQTTSKIHTDHHCTKYLKIWGLTNCFQSNESKQRFTITERTKYDVPIKFYFSTFFFSWIQIYIWQYDTL